MHAGGGGSSCGLPNQRPCLAHPASWSILASTASGCSGRPRSSASEWQASRHSLQTQGGSCCGMGWCQLPKKAWRVAQPEAAPTQLGCSCSQGRPGRWLALAAPQEPPAAPGANGGSHLASAGSGSGGGQASSGSGGGSGGGDSHSGSRLAAGAVMRLPAVAGAVTRMPAAAVRLRRSADGVEGPTGAAAAAAAPQQAAPHRQPAQRWLAQPARRREAPACRHQVWQPAPRLQPAGLRPPCLPRLLPHAAQCSGCQAAVASWIAAWDCWAHPLLPAH